MAAPLFHCNRWRRAWLKQMKGWRLARTSLQHEMWPKTLLTSVRKGSRLTTTMNPCLRTCPLMGTFHPPMKASTKANLGDRMALISGSPWGGGNYDGPLSPNRWTPQGMSFLDLFLYFFSMAWFLTVLLAKTDEAV
jgi:hypothetical protein